MAQYSDYLLLAGVALCVVSVVYAIVQLMQTQPPRGAAITLIVGIVLLFAGALAAPQPVTPQEIFSAWSRVTSGQVEDTAPLVEEGTADSN